MAQETTAEFSFRLNQAVEAHPQAPVTIHGRQRWLLRKLAAEADTEVSANTMHKWFNGMARPREDNSANSVRILASQVFRFAAGEGAVDSDPADIARDALVKRKDRNHAAVTEPKEVGALMRAIRQSHAIRYPAIRAGLLLSAYLFPRNTQLRMMRWDQIEGDTWAVPAEQMKLPRDHLVPLPRQAIEVLEWIRPITGGSDLVLASPMSKSGLLSENTFNKALDVLGYDKTRHRQHGFRTTFSTNMHEMDWNPDWIEMQLAHLSGSKVRRVYNKARWLPQRREMMQAYADWLDEVSRP